eukprot:356340-Chlamydomonas_euryale.AAC.2
MPASSLDGTPHIPPSGVILASLTWALDANTSLCRPEQPGARVSAVTCINRTAEIGHLLPS